MDPLKLKEIKGRLVLANSNLEMSKSLLKKGEFVRGATDLGYNAAELCARALILLKQDDLPSRHRGIVQKFSELYIKDGPLEKEVGRRLNKGLDYRNNARYVPDAEITKDHAVHNITLAKELINFLEKELKANNLQKSNSGLGLIGVLLILGVLVITAGGVVAWRGERLCQHLQGQALQTLK